MGLLLGVLGAPPLIAWDGSQAINGVCVGNSIFSNHGGQTLMATLLQSSEVGTAIGATWTDAAHNGYKWNDLAVAGYEADQAWDPDADVNVLVLHEWHNQIAGNIDAGMTAAQAFDLGKAYLAQYVQDRLDLHPWKILLTGSLPAGGSSAWVEKNATLADTDTWSQANHRSLRCHGWAGYRHITPFAVTGNTASDFSANASSWYETAAPYMHPTTAAKTLMRDQAIIPALRLLRR